MLLIAFLSTVCFSVTAQIKDTIGLNVPVLNGHVVYQGVIDVPGMSKEGLYQNSRQWFVDYFKSSKDVIQNEDKDQGRIVGKGIILIPWKTMMGSGEYNCRITIQVDVKDNKYRYKIYDMILTTTISSLGSYGTAEPYDFTPEEMINKLGGTGGKLMVTKGQCKKLLEALNLKTNMSINSLKKAMIAKVDTF